MQSLDWPAAVHGAVAFSQWVVAVLIWNREPLCRKEGSLSHDSLWQEGRNTDSDSEIELHDVYPDARTSGCPAVDIQLATKHRVREIS